MKIFQRPLGASMLAVAAVMSVGGCSSDDNGNGGSVDASTNPAGDAAPDSAGDSAANSMSDSSMNPAGETSTSDAGEAGPGDAGAAKEVVYANSGVTLNTFDLAADGTLSPKASMSLGQTLQFAYFDSKSQHLYAGVGATSDPLFSLHAFSIDAASGLLTEIPASADGGGVVSPNGRIINLTLSRDDKYLLTIHNVTKAYTVFQLNADGTIGARVQQADGGDTGIGAYLHQVRVDPSNKYATICDRGNDPVYASDGGVMTPEDIGHLRVFTYASGLLTPVDTSTITFPTGIGPRHLDFHPSQPWVYLSAERGNRLITYTFSNGVLTEKFNTTSVAVAGDMGMLNATEAINGQRAGAIMVHPSGKFLWITNRNWALEPYTPDAGAAVGSSEAGSADASSEAGAASDAAALAPVQVFTGNGENNVALFKIDQMTGEPTFVAATDSHGFEPRTFALDPSGRFLIVGNQKRVNTLTSAGVVAVLPNLSVFQVGADGTLTFLKTYDQSGGEVLWEGVATATGM